MEPPVSVPVAAGARPAATATADPTKPDHLSHERACTLPVTWSTVHAACNRLWLRAANRLVAHAAAGGVGLKALEYAHWLRARALGSAGRPSK